MSSRHVWMLVVALAGCEGTEAVGQRVAALGSRDQALRDALLQAAEQHLAIPFNPQAALQHAIVGARAHYAPNSREIAAPQVHEAPPTLLQRAENLITGVVRHAASAYLTYVALDLNGKPREVPPLILETEEERRRNIEARRRRDVRFAEKKQEAEPLQP